MAKSLNLNVITILALVTIWGISQTSGVCCEQANYAIYHRCYGRSEIKVPSRAKIDHFYERKNYTPVNPFKCQTNFCSDGSVQDRHCGIGGFTCKLMGCFCSDCRINNGTSYKDMEKVWVKEAGFDGRCTGIGLGHCTDL